MAMKIIPYKAGSESAKALAEELGIARLKLEGSRWKGKAGDVVINWGTSRMGHPAFEGAARVLNHPDNVVKASNKLSSFDAFTDANVACPAYTTSHDEACNLLKNGSTIVVREKLNGHSGEGITIITPEAYLSGDVVVPKAPLYTNYIKKVNEYRAHVFGGNVFFVQRKARKKDVPDEEVNWQVRNHANGFIFAHEGVDIPDDVKELAVGAVAALGLDFGAVDLIQTKMGKWYVLEVNTACGLAGTTLKKYAEQFRNLL